MKPISVRLRPGDALVLVDVQNDFLPSGNLAVPAGEEVVPLLNRYIEKFTRADLPVFATRDWHPPDHCSFSSHEGVWPPHCVAGTRGAEFADNLAVPESATVISKAVQAQKDAYSGFDGTNLNSELQQRHVQRVFVGGLATDYCVLNTVIDALGNGYEVFLLIDAIRAVDVQPQDGARAIEDMLRSGAQPVELDTVTAAASAGA